MTIRRRLTKSETEGDPNVVWNAFIDLLAMESVEDLSGVQRQAHLVFWYESEVQNGGHFQYFENRGLGLVPETIDSLRALGANQFAEVLSDALTVASERTWGKVATVEQYLEESDVWNFEKQDGNFEDCAPNLIQVLAEHLASNRDQYIEILSDPD